MMYARGPNEVFRAQSVCLLIIYILLGLEVFNMRPRDDIVVVYLECYCPMWYRT